MEPSFQTVCFTLCLSLYHSLSLSMIEINRNFCFFTQKHSGNGQPTENRLPHIFLFHIYKCPVEKRSFYNGLNSTNNTPVSSPFSSMLSQCHSAKLCAKKISISFSWHIRNEFLHPVFLFLCVFGQKQYTDSLDDETKTKIRKKKQQNTSFILLIMFSLLKLIALQMKIS